MTSQTQQKELTDLQKEYDDEDEFGKSTSQALHSDSLLKLIEEGIFAENALACVQYVNHLFTLEEKIRATQLFEVSALKRTVEQLRSRKYRRYFFRAARDYNANTLEAISKADTSGIFVLSLGLTAYINQLCKKMFAATTTESQLNYGKLLSSFKKERLKELVQIARQYDAKTLCDILQSDAYGFFSRVLLADSRIVQTLESCGKVTISSADGTTEYYENGLAFARKQLYTHLEALEKFSQTQHLRDANGNFKVPLTSGIDPFANLIGACRLKCIDPHQYKWGFNRTTGFIGWLRDFFGYHFSKEPYNNIGTLSQIPIRLGRQPTLAVINELKPNLQPGKKILLISIQTPDEGYTDGGILKKFFRGSFFNKTHLITAESVPENVNRLSLSLMDHSIDIAPQALLDFVNLVKTSVDTGAYGLVYSHCRGGKARSAGITALVKCCCNNITLEAAFTEITTNRSSAKGFASFGHKRADVLIRTYFLMAAGNPENALFSADADGIATHLKWYLENATLNALNKPGEADSKTSCDNFWQVVEKLAQDKDKFPQVLTKLLPNLSDKALEKLMKAIKLHQSQPVPAASDSAAAVQTEILIEVQKTLQHRETSKPLLKLLGNFYDAAITLFKPETAADEVRQARKEVFLAYPETLKVEKQVPGVDTQQIGLALGTSDKKSPATDVAASVTEISQAAHTAAERADYLMSVSLSSYRHKLNPTDEGLVLVKLKENSGLVLLKSGKHDIYRASLDNGKIKLTKLEHHHPALEKLFPIEKGSVCKHALSRLGGSSRTISTEPRSN